jgi:hypothetical protein
MASGRWNIAINEWLIMASETRLAMSQTDDKQIWKLRLKKLQDLVVYALIEAKVRSQYESDNRILTLRFDN